MSFSMKQTRVVFFSLLCLSTTLTPINSEASTVLAGKMSFYRLFNSSVMSFRVYLQNVTIACTGGPDYAFISTTDVNYKSMAAALMSAKVTGANLQLVTDPVIIGGGTQCQINQVIVQN